MLLIALKGTRTLVFFLFPPLGCPGRWRYRRAYICPSEGPNGIKLELTPCSPCTISQPSPLISAGQEPATLHSRPAPPSGDHPRCDLLLSIGSRFQGGVLDGHDFRSLFLMCLSDVQSSLFTALARTRSPTSTQPPGCLPPPSLDLLVDVFGFCLSLTPISTPYCPLVSFNASRLTTILTHGDQLGLGCCLPPGRDRVKLEPPSSPFKPFCFHPPETSRRLFYAVD